MAVVCKHLANRAPNAIVGVLIEALQHPHYFPMIDNRGSIAKHVYRPATNRSIGVGGHLQNALPHLRNLGFQFAWAERPECSAALPRVGTVSEFKPVRGIALASSHDRQGGSSRPGVRSRLLEEVCPKPPTKVPCLVLEGQTRGLNQGHLGVIRAPGVTRFAQGGLLSKRPS